MLTRIWSALIGVALLVVVLWAADPLLNYALVAVILIALFEIYRSFGFIKMARLPLAVIGFSLAIALCFGDFTNYKYILFLLCAYIILMFVLAVCYHKSIKFSDIAILLFSTLYITMPLLHIRMIHENANGIFLIYTVFIGAFVSDTGAYFCGRFLGKHKLMPEISPNKTIEGSIGGIVFTLIGFLVFGLILSRGFHFNVNFINAMIVAVLASAAAQMGDLSASMIKREYNIKDYGTIMPGHGGMLDRIDSVIFVAPVVYYMMTVLPIIIS